MKFSSKTFSLIILFQTIVFGAVFSWLGQGIDFLITMTFFYLNVLGWAFFVITLCNESTKEQMSPVVVLLGVGKEVIAFCLLWLLLGKVSVLAVATSNVLIAFSLIVSCMVNVPKLEFYNGK